MLMPSPWSTSPSVARIFVQLLDGEDGVSCKAGKTSAGLSPVLAVLGGGDVLLLPCAASATGGAGLSLSWWYCILLCYLHWLIRQLERSLTGFSGLVVPDKDLWLSSSMIKKRRWMIGTQIRKGRCEGIS